MEEWQEGIEQNMSDTEVGGTNHIFSASGDIVSCIRVSKGVLHRGKAALPWEAMWEPFKHTRPVQYRVVTREFSFHQLGAIIMLSLSIGAIIMLSKTIRLCHCQESLGEKDKNTQRARGRDVGAV